MRLTKFFIGLIIITTSSAQDIKKWKRTYEPGERIIGGSYPPVGLYPWFSANADRQCGGNLITSRHILTAAHCASAFEVGDRVYVGIRCWYTSNCGQEPRELRTVLLWKPHPGYSSTATSIKNDLAIITLSSDSTITPVKLDLNGVSSNYTRANKLFTAGLGVASAGSAITSNVLKHVEVSFVPHDVCKVSYPDIDDSSICAADPGRYGDKPYWEDACQGDSGGPLYDKENDLLVGIVSFGEGCAKVQYPGVYSDISNQAQWIKDNVCNDYSLGDSNRPDFCDSPIEPETSPYPAPRWCENELETGIELEFITDSYPEENNVTLFNHYGGGILGQLIFDGSPEQRSTSNRLRACVLPLNNRGDVCVDLEVYDSVGDGLFLPGGFHMRMDDKQVVFEYSLTGWFNRTYSGVCVDAREPQKGNSGKMLYSKSIQWFLLTSLALGIFLT